MAIIAHLDMDAFFAAIEERDHPQWKGKPIVVGSDPRGGQGRGVVSTANYAARKFGIRSATPIRLAWRLAKAAEARGESETIFLSGHWHKYSDTSHRILDCIRRFASDMQPSGVDEAYFDLSFTRSFAAAQLVCQKIKETIYTEEQLTASIGIGPNKLIAKIASDFKKPDGLTVVLPEQAGGFLEPLPIRTLPGIGPKTEADLKRRGITTILDLKHFSLEDLKDQLGAWGEKLYRKARGLGSSKLSDPAPPKSLSEQHTFFHDTRDPFTLVNYLNNTAKNLLAYLHKEKFKTFRTVTVTVRFADFETHTYSHTLPHPISSLKKLRHEGLRLLLPFLDHRKNPQGKLIRLIGLRIEKLQP